MSKEMMEVVKEHAKETYEKKTKVPDEKAEEAAEETSKSILAILMEMILKGDISQLKELLSGKQVQELLQSPIVQQIIKRVSEYLQKTQGLNKKSADEAAQLAVPNALEQVSKKYASKDPADAKFDVTTFVQTVLDKEGRQDLMATGRGIVNNIGEQAGLGKNLASRIGSFFRNRRKRRKRRR